MYSGDGALDASWKVTSTVVTTMNRPSVPIRLLSLDVSAEVTGHDGKRRPMERHDGLAVEFEVHRTRLRAVAYRMLGSARSSRRRAGCGSTAPTPTRCATSAAGSHRAPARHAGRTPRATR